MLPTAAVEKVMKQNRLAVSGLAATLLIAGCATPPPGPTVMAAKGPNISDAQYQQDQSICAEHARQITAREADEANNRAVGAGVIGTLAGAALGAAVGGGRGAAIGAASGAVVGGSIGANQSAWSNMPLQRRYDSLYLQCMSATGNSVPYYYMPPPVAYYYPAPAAPPPVYYAPPPSSSGTVTVSPQQSGTITPPTVTPH
jgi:uncharacterized protein YcfJ